MYECYNCSKKYIRKSNLDKHKLLCDFLRKTEREKKIDMEETTGLPSYVELVQIVQELVLKNKKLETMVTDFQKHIEKRKNKINIINWLSNNVKPEYNYDDLLNKIKITKLNIDYLLKNNINVVLLQIITENFNRLKEDKNIPIYCFSQKNKLYIYKNNNENVLEWEEWSHNDILIFLNSLHKKIVSELFDWYNENTKLIDKDDKMSIMYNTSVIKLMGVDFNNDITFGKTKSYIYNTLKYDLSKIIEYEMEF